MNGKRVNLISMCFNTYAALTDWLESTKPSNLTSKFMLKRAEFPALTTMKLLILASVNLGLTGFVK